MFPFEPTNLFARGGGRISLVHGLTHEKHKPSNGYSQDGVFVIVDIEHEARNGHPAGKNVKLPVPLLGLVCDVNGSDESWRKIADAQDAYMREHGAFYGEDSKHRGWYANREPKAA